MVGKFIIYAFDWINCFGDDGWLEWDSILNVPTQTNRYFVRLVSPFLLFYMVKDCWFIRFFFLLELSKRSLIYPENQIEPKQSMRKNNGFCIDYKMWHVNGISDFIVRLITFTRKKLGLICELGPIWMTASAQRRWRFAKSIAFEMRDNSLEVVQKKMCVDHFMAREWRLDTSSHHLIVAAEKDRRKPQQDNKNELQI